MLGSKHIVTRVKKEWNVKHQEDNNKRKSYENMKAHIPLLP